MDYVYLIKLDSKLSNRAQYYIGYTPRHPLERLKTHRSKHGSRILAAAVENGIEFHIVRVWENADKTFERSLKKRKNAKVFCPLTNPKLSQFLYEHHAA